MLEGFSDVKEYICILFVLLSLLEVNQQYQEFNCSGIKLVGVIQILVKSLYEYFIFENHIR